MNARVIMAMVKATLVTLLLVGFPSFVYLALGGRPDPGSAAVIAAVAATLWLIALGGWLGIFA